MLSIWTSLKILSFGKELKLELCSANSLSLIDFKILCLGKG